MTTKDPIQRAVEAIAEAESEILPVMPTDELREHVERFVAGLLNIAHQRKTEIL